MTLPESLSWIAAFALLAGCGGSRLEITLDKPDPERLLAFWFGSYLGPEGGDPFEAGILTERRGRFWVDPDALPPGAGDELRRRSHGGSVEWDGLAEFLQATYYDARGVPRTVAEFESYKSWLSHDVHGPVTTARRRVYVAEDAVRAALAAYRANGERLVYPAGTAFVAEHRLRGELLETTAMIKRADGFWDFMTYGADGNLAPRTAALPRGYDSPTQCVGCHFGTKLFEPERSFPGAALPGPDGPRAIYAEGSAHIVRYFDEHRRRSDTALGLHATLYVSRLLRRSPSDADRQLLEQLGL